MSHIKEKLMKLRNRRRTGDRGFSLVELGVVVVVIGILVSIAVPVFNGIQDGAKLATAKAAAANGSSMVASEVAATGVRADAVQDMTAFQKLAPGDEDTITVEGSDLGNFCVTAIVSDKRATKGPGCVEGGSEVTGPFAASLSIMHGWEAREVDELNGFYGRVVVTFSKPVTGLTVDDFTAENANINEIRTTDGGTTWEMTLMPTVATTTPGQVVILDLSGVADLEGNRGVGTATSKPIVYVR